MRTLLCAVWMIAATLATAGETPRTFDLSAPETLKAQAEFAGTWSIVAVKPEGAAKDAKQLVFRKDWTYAALDKDGKELWAGTYELDPKTQPPTWDHRSDDAKKKGGDALGIYELKGDTLKVSVVVGIWSNKTWSGKSRPTSVDSTETDAALELSRAK